MPSPCFVSLVFVGQLGPSVPAEPCGLNHAHDRLFMLRPETREAASWQRKPERNPERFGRGNCDEILIIPIVFHVMPTTA